MSKKDMKFVKYLELIIFKFLLHFIEFIVFSNFQISQSRIEDAFTLLQSRVILSV